MFIAGQEVPRLRHRLPLRMDMGVVSWHVPEDAILEAPQVGGEAVEVGRMEVQRAVLVVQAVVHMLVVVGAHHSEAIPGSRRPGGRRVKHRMQSSRHRYWEPKSPTTALGSCIGGPR